MQVQRCRQPGMEQIGMAGRHGILVGAKLWQTVPDEIPQRRPGLIPAAIGIDGDGDAVPHRLADGPDDGDIRLGRGPPEAQLEPREPGVRGGPRTGHGLVGGAEADLRMDRHGRIAAPDVARAAAE